MSRWTFGDISVDRVIESERPLFEPSILFPDSTQAALDHHRPWLEPDLIDPETGLLIFAFHSFVVRTPRHTIVVDTCSGNERSRPQKPRYHMNHWPYLENLAAAGVRPTPGCL